MRTLLPVVLLAIPLAAGAQPAAPAPNPPVPNSPLQWEVREGNHPRMGPIRVAVPASSVATVVGKEKILSLVFFSCEKRRGKIAIELANAAESDARGGLYPKQMPRLFCNPRSVSAARSEIAATWFVSEIGDALANGLSPSDLRGCASIDVVQDLALPRAWGAETQRIEIEIIPYRREVESVLSSCVEGPALAARQEPPPAKAPSPPVVAAAPARPAVAAPPAPRVNSASPAIEPPWRSARTISSGKTNVRAAPSIDASLVTQLDPGALLLVQSTSSEWWRVKPRTGTAFTGFIRQDRLAFE